MTTNIAVLSDSDLFGAGLEAVVSGDPELLIRGRAGSTDALDLLEEVHPDVVVLDYGSDGAARLCQTLRRRYPAVPVLVVSTRSSDEAPRSSVEAGASGFVYADVDRRALRSTITTLASTNPHAETTEIHTPVHDSPLSARELDVLRLVAQGKPNKVIARSLGIGENTVKTYLRRVFAKFGCETRSAATSIATKRGLI